jgi:hypothetical protein
MNLTAGTRDLRVRSSRETVESMQTTRCARSLVVRHSLDQDASLASAGTAPFPRIYRLGSIVGPGGSFVICKIPQVLPRSERRADSVQGVRYCHIYQVN